MARCAEVEVASRTQELRAGPQCAPGILEVLGHVEKGDRREARRDLLQGAREHGQPFVLRQVRGLSRWLVTGNTQ